MIYLGMTSMQPLVSIIIPFYNVEDYLGECLESIVNQDYENLQIIAINDGSNDNSLVIMNSYVKTNTNWLVETIPNGGQSTARNTGLKYADGKYILFLDSDDKILPDTVSTCVKTMEKDDISIFLFAGQSFFTEKGMEKHSFNYDRKVYSQIKGIDFLERSLHQGNYIVQPCMYMFKKSCFTEIEFYPDILHEDNLFTTQLLINNNALVSSTDKILYLRRFRNNSTMTQPVNMRHVIGYKTVVFELLKLKKSNNSKHINEVLSSFNNIMIENFIITSFIFFKKRVPIKYRKSFISFYLQNKCFNFKNLILSFVPEILLFK